MNDEYDEYADSGYMDFDEEEASQPLEFSMIDPVTGIVTHYFLSLPKEE